MSESVVAVRLRAINEQYDQAMARSQQATERFTTSSGRTLASLGTDMTRVGGMMSRRVTLPIIGVGVASLAASANFERGMNRVRGLTGATGDDFEALQAQARDLGATTQYSASQAADAMGFLAMAGFEASEIVEAMPSTLQLAAAAQLDLARAADITSNILTGYGLQVEDLGHANDVLATAMTSANTNLEQLGEAMKYAGPVARGAGMEFEEATAALALMGNAGIQGSMAGTSLRGALVRLMNPTNAVGEAIERLGLDIYESDGSLRSMTDIVGELERSGASTADMMMIFGQRAGPAMAALVSQGSDELMDLTENLRNSDGAAQELADINMEGLAGSLLLLKSAAEALAISLGDSGLLDVATKIVTWMATGIQAASDFAPWVLQLGIAFGLLLAAVGPVLSIGGRLLTNMGHLINGFQMLGRGASGAVGGIRSVAAALGPTGLAGVAGIAAIGVAAVAYSIHQSRQRAEEARRRIQAYADAIEAAGDAAEGAADALAQMLRDSPDMARLFDDASVTTRDFTEAALEGGDAWDEMRGRILDAGEAAGFTGLKLEAFENVLNSARDEILQGAEHTEVLARVIDETGDNAEGAIPAFGDFEDALEGIGAEAEDTVTELEALNDLYKAMFDPVFALERAMRGHADAQEKVTEAVKEHGAGSSEAAEAEWELFRATVELQSAVNTLLDDVEGGRITWDNAKTMLGEWAAAGLLTEEQADSIGTAFDGLAIKADELDGRTVNMSVTADVSQALEGFGQLSEAARSTRSWRAPVGGPLSSSSRGMQPRALGGPVTAGQPYLVNENTPRSEVFVPGTHGAVLTPAQFRSMIGGGSGGSAPENHYHLDRALSAGEVEQLGDYLARRQGWDAVAGGVG